MARRSIQALSWLGMPKLYIGAPTTTMAAAPDVGVGDPAREPISFDGMYRRRRWMLDGVSLDQLRSFIAAVDAGSFSAAGRRLGRAQSVISQTLANLEGQLGVRLFDRGG